MQAQVADRFVVRRTKVGQPARTGEVLELIASHGAPRYRVRWSDGHESIFSPGPDASIDTRAMARADDEWTAAVAVRRARSAAWRRGVVAGVGKEASLAQEAIDRRPAGDERVAG